MSMTPDERQLDKAITELAQLRNANKMLRQAEANYDALQTPMACGHLARYAVLENGTQYCSLCALSEAGALIQDLVLKPFEGDQ